MTPKSIHFLPSGKTCPVDDAESVLDVALRHELEISRSCGGMGSCTTCRVRIVSGGEAVPPRNELEMDIAEMRGWADDERLSCQLPPVPGLVVRIPDPT